MMICSTDGKIFQLPRQSSFTMELDNNKNIVRNFESNIMVKGRTTSGIAELPNFEHFGTSLPNCLRTVRRPLLYYKDWEILVIFSAS